MERAIPYVLQHVRTLAYTILRNETKRNETKSGEIEQN